MNKILRINIVLAILCCLSFIDLTYAQQVIKVSLNDEIHLEAGEYEGNIQWQISTDNVNWSDIAKCYTKYILCSYYRTNTIL